WIQHFIHHLAPGGIAGFVMSNGSLSSNTSGEGEIRKAIIEADLVDCIVALPGQLFYTTAIPVSLWFISRDKKGHQGKTLFIDARKLGTLIDRSHRDFADTEIEQVITTYHNWKSANNSSYSDISGFCNSSPLSEIREQDYILNPGRYVGITSIEEDDESILDQIIHLQVTILKQFQLSKKIEEKIVDNLGKIKYGT
ncbi:MAG TPA: N-6 DNA methylase, partial [Anaerolineaceae bacterium]|nr:N-6 DNA methylase [Anaerolineaceae bacterium]